MRILSGIQPTGDKHLGNYSGDSGSTSRSRTRRRVLLHRRPARHHRRLRPGRTPRVDALLAALLFATGLDPERSTLFVQSHVHDARRAAPGCSARRDVRRAAPDAPVQGEVAERQEFISAGLLTYPVLMAADILLYQADLVPVGDDQRQHLELARDLAERFNNRFGETFMIPEASYPGGRRPGHGPAGARAEDVDHRRYRAGIRRCSTRPDVIRKKFKTAVTDSGRDVRRARTRRESRT